MLCTNMSECVQNRNHINNNSNSEIVIYLHSQCVTAAQKSINAIPFIHRSFQFQFKFCIYDQLYSTCNAQTLLIHLKAGHETIGDETLGKYSNIGPIIIFRPQVREERILAWTDRRSLEALARCYSGFTRNLILHAEHTLYYFAINRNLWAHIISGGIYSLKLA